MKSGEGGRIGGPRYYSMLVVNPCTAGSDYVSLDLVANITNIPDLMCFQITPLEDSMIENRERFDVELTSDDPSVVIDRARSRVFVDDTTSMFLMTLLDSYHQSYIIFSYHHSIYANRVQCARE